MYGQEFRELRLQQNISLEQASKDIVSPSTLSRWENNKIDIRFELVVKLLKNIHINLKEFTNFCKIDYSNAFVTKVAKYYENSNDKVLFNLAKKQNEKYAHSHSQYDLLLFAIACNCYYDLTQKNIFPSNYHKKLFYILSNTEYWTEIYINIFGNTVFLYDSQELYSISSRIINNLSSETFNDFQEYYYALSATTNSLVALILKNPKLAVKLLKKLKNIKIPRPISYLKIRINILSDFLNYRLNKENEELIFIKLMNLKQLGLNDISEDLLFLFNRIRNL